MADRPGTVSKILWHFTGGPTWNVVQNRQNTAPKTTRAAYAALVSILRSRELRIGQYKEVVKVRLPYIRSYDESTHSFKTKKNVLVEETSLPVCCLADIPVIHLQYQAQRYGKFAIGFHRNAAIAHGFNPVLYTLHDTQVLRSIYEGFSQLKHTNTDYITSAANDIEEAINDAECNRGHEVEIDISNSLLELEMTTDDLETAVDESRDSFQKFLAFIKTFDMDEFPTIYCEREWRSVSSFKFSYDDVAMIVLPKQQDHGSYYRKFVSGASVKLKLPRSIPFVPWEDLLES